MSSSRWAGVLLLAGLIAGCTPTRRTVVAPPPPPAPVLSLDQAHAQLSQSNPQAVVGEVRGVMESRHMVAVGEIPAGALNASDVVSIVEPNSALTLVADATVLKLQDGYYIVSYTPGTRTPHFGDFVLHLPQMPHDVNTGATPNSSAPTPATQPAPASEAPATPAPALAPAPAAETPASAPAPSENKPAPSTPADSSAPKPSDLNK